MKNSIKSVILMLVKISLLVFVGHAAYGTQIPVLVQCSIEGPVFEGHINWPEKKAEWGCVGEQILALVPISIVINEIEYLNVRPVVANYNCHTFEKIGFGKLTGAGRFATGNILMESKAGFKIELLGPYNMNSDSKAAGLRLPEGILPLGSQNRCSLRSYE